jgi:hypothetical protein
MVTSVPVVVHRLSTWNSTYYAINTIYNNYLQMLCKHPLALCIHLCGNKCASSCTSIRLSTWNSTYFAINTICSSEMLCFCKHPLALCIHLCSHLCLRTWTQLNNYHCPLDCGGHCPPCLLNNQMKSQPPYPKTSSYATVLIKDKILSTYPYHHRILS